MAQIDKPNLHFNTKLHTGTGSTTTITGVGFQPDMTWWKSRSNAVNHALYDAVRGGSKLLRPNQTNAEETNAAVSAFTSDGVTLTGGDAFTNTSGYTYASWNWKANGTGSSNTNGTITSTVSANQTAGFSIVKYTGNGTAGATIGHGLSSVPNVVLIKALTSSTQQWNMYHSSLGNGSHMHFNLTNAVNSSSTYFNNTTPTSSVFSVGSYFETNESSTDFIAYCFAEKKGYSKFGSYTGNGNADGTFVYTGFKPAFVIIKETSDTGNWCMSDNKRDGYNPTKNLYVDKSDVENTANTIDHYSNGFKIRSTGGSVNTSGSNMIYMAFAEEPLVGTNNIPATAR